MKNYTSPMTGDEKLLIAGLVLLVICVPPIGFIVSLMIAFSK